MNFYYEFDLYLRALLYGGVLLRRLDPTGHVQASFKGVFEVGNSFVGLVADIQMELQTVGLFDVVEYFLGNQSNLDLIGLS